MRFLRSMARGQSEATPARTLFSVMVVVGAAVLVVGAIVLLAYALA